MAIRKIGSRQILVDGVAYCWRIRQRATYFQTDYGSGTLIVAIESHDQAGAVLILDSNRPHPKDCFPKSLAPVTPADISHWIRQAIAAGWKPFKPGPQFRMNIRQSAAKIAATQNAATTNGFDRSSDQYRSNRNDLQRDS